ncbi:MAG: hypothetical protein K2N73_09950 [Lachnospiraceae bacterium]|nr:hypothetical protein [Lachnospiraceae bacterium]
MNNIFYAGILNRLVLAEYDGAVRIVVWMVSVILVLKLVAKGCERVVHHYCKPCEYEIKKRTAQKAFSMEYEAVDRTETLEAFRRVRAGEKGMGGVERQLWEIYEFFQELAGMWERTQELPRRLTRLQRRRSMKILIHWFRTRLQSTFPTA